MDLIDISSDLGDEIYSVETAKNVEKYAPADAGVDLSTIPRLLFFIIFRTPCVFLIKKHQGI